MSGFRSSLIRELEFNISIFCEMPSLDCFGELLDRKLNAMIINGITNARLFSLNLPFRSLHLIMLSLAEDDCIAQLRRMLLTIIRHRKVREERLVVAGREKKADFPTVELNFEGATFEYLNLLAKGSFEEGRKLAVIYSMSVFRGNCSLRKIFGRLLYETGMAFLYIAPTREAEEASERRMNWPLECLEIPGFYHPDAHDSLISWLQDCAKLIE